MEKRYGLPTAIAMVIGIVIGSGIFFKTEAVLKVTGGNVFTGMLSLVIMGLVLIACAYAFALLAGKYSKVNGVVDYAEVCCGNKYSYYLGWFMTFIYTPAITSVLGWVSAMYFGALFGWGVGTVKVLLLGILFLVVDFFLNTWKPKAGGDLQVVTTVIKLVPLVLMAVIGIIAGLKNGQLTSNFLSPATPDVSAFGGLTASVVSLAFAFEGWILATSINSELKDSKKNLPRALIIGSIIIVIIYVLYYLGICGTISVDELLASSSTAAFQKLFGNVFGTVLSVCIVISCLGTMNGLMMANIRNIYSLAVRGHGPKPAVFSKMNEKTNMPTNSCILGCVLAVVWVLYFWGANVNGTWFGLFSFDSSELPIITLYAMYIPMFAKMFNDAELPERKRKVLAVLAIICCIFLVIAAFYSHGIVKFVSAKANGQFSFPVLFYLIIFAVIMFIGKFFYNEKEEK